MSYCRMGVDGSSVYAYKDIRGGYSGWALNEQFNFKTLEEFADYMLRLRMFGENIPDYVFDQIKEELSESTQSNKA